MALSSSLLNVAGFKARNLPPEKSILHFFILKTKINKLTILELKLLGNSRVNTITSLAVTDRPSPPTKASGPHVDTSLSMNPHILSMQQFYILYLSTAFGFVYNL